MKEDWRGEERRGILTKREKEIKMRRRMILQSRINRRR
jgi:hypothetical protein